MTAAWFTAQQIAQLALPDLPSTESAVIRRATREGWPFRQREARGGGREYPVSALPAEARVELMRREADAAPPVPVTQPMLPAPPVPATATMADWQRRTMDARAAILAEVERLAMVGGITAAIAEVVARARAGTLPDHLQRLVASANARGGKTGTRTLTERTVYYWRAEAKRGVSALAPIAPAPAEVAPAWAGPLLKAYRRPQKPTLTSVLRNHLPAMLPPGVPMPSESAARRFLKSLPPAERERGRHGPNALLAFQAFKRRSTDGFAPLTEVMADGHTFKAHIMNPRTGKPFNPEVCGVMDTTTRYLFGYSAGLAESSHVIRDAIRRGVEQLGQFAIFYTDNGSGFVARAMTDEVVGLLGRINAARSNSTPGRAQARGKIERLQQIWKEAARELATYTGRDMDREAALRVKKLVKLDYKETGTSRRVMAWEDFVTWLGQVVDRYNNRPHRGLPRITDPVTGRKRHQSPAEALADHRARGWQPMMVDPDLLDDLFRPYEERKAFRGEVKFRWGTYFHRDLANYNEMVRVGYDPFDGSRVWVRTLDEGRLICVAERDGNLIPSQPQNAVQDAMDRRARGQLRLVNEKAERIDAERRGALQIEHAAPPVPAFTLDPAFEAAHAETVRRLEAPPAPAAEPMSDEDAWYARACDLIARRDAGETLPPRDAAWLAANASAPWFTVRRDFERQRAAFMAHTAPAPRTPNTDPTRKTA